MHDFCYFRVEIKKFVMKTASAAIVCVHVCESIEIYAAIEMRQFRNGRRFLTYYVVG